MVEKDRKHLVVDFINFYQYSILYPSLFIDSSINLFDIIKSFHKNVSIISNNTKYLDASQEIDLYLEDLKKEIFLLKEDYCNLIKEWKIHYLYKLDSYDNSFIDRMMRYYDYHITFNKSIEKTNIPNRFYYYIHHSYHCIRWIKNAYDMIHFWVMKDKSIVSIYNSIMNEEENFDYKKNSHPNISKICSLIRDRKIDNIYSSDTIPSCFDEENAFITLLEKLQIIFDNIQDRSERIIHTYVIFEEKSYSFINDILNKNNIVLNDYYKYAYESIMKHIASEEMIKNQTIKNKDNVVLSKEDVERKYSFIKGEVC